MGVKRLVAIAISAAALVAPPGLWAQRGGGGHASGGGHSFGGHAGGGFSSFHSSPAPVSRPSTSGYGSARQAFSGRRGPNGGGYPGRPYRNWYYGYGYGYPYGYGYGFYPYGYYIPSSLSYAGFPEDYQSGQGGAEAPPQDYGPPPYDEGQGYPGPGYPPYPPGPAYGPPGYGPGYGAEGANAPAAPAAEAQLPTVLVYRDGHQMEVQNYAIYGQTIWVFGDQITRKIALSDLDVARTKQLNDQRGVEFDIPESTKPVG